MKPSINKNLVLWLELQMAKRGWHTHDGQMQPHPVAVKNHQEYFSGAEVQERVNSPSVSTPDVSTWPLKRDFPALKFGEKLSQVAANALKQAKIQRVKRTASNMVRGWSSISQSGIDLDVQPFTDDIKVSFASGFRGERTPERKASEQREIDKATEALKQVGFKSRNDEHGNTIISPDYDLLSEDERKTYIENTIESLAIAKKHWTENLQIANKYQAQGYKHQAREHRHSATKDEFYVSKLSKRLHTLQSK